MCERLECRTLCHELYISTLKFLSISMQATKVIENLKLLDPCSQFFSTILYLLKNNFGFLFPNVSTPCANALNKQTNTQANVALFKYTLRGCRPNLPFLCYFSLMLA